MAERGKVLSRLSKIYPNQICHIIPSYYSFNGNLQFTVDMEWGSLFSGGSLFSCTAEKCDPLILFSNNVSLFSMITFFRRITFSCTAEKSDPLLLFSNNGSHFFRDHFFSLHRTPLEADPLKMFPTEPKSCWRPWL